MGATLPSLYYLRCSRLTQTSKRNQPGGTNTVSYNEEGYRGQSWVREDEPGCPLHPSQGNDLCVRPLQVLVGY